MDNPWLIALLMTVGTLLGCGLIIVELILSMYFFGEIWGTVIGMGIPVVVMYFIIVYMIKD
jgi:hypothetical protein